jgi:hypothetical protein
MRSVIMGVVIYWIMIEEVLVSVPIAFFGSHRSSSEPNQQTVDMQDLVDIDVFLDAKRVIDSLQNKEITPALAWCAENKSRLKKSKVCVILCYLHNSYRCSSICTLVRWSE